MVAYKNPRNPVVQSNAGLSATKLQAELFEFGVELKGQKPHFELTNYILRYGEAVVRAVAMKALDKYTEGADGTQGITAEGYIMERLKVHHWERNGHR